jgi:DNA-binding Xre family transcriptional regulator
VKEVAKEKGFSMGKLQRDADVAYNTVKRMFKDPYYITTTETLGKLARALGVQPGELIEEVPNDIHKNPSSRLTPGGAALALEDFEENLSNQ